MDPELKMRSITFLSVNYMITYARLSCVLLLTMEGDAILKLFYMAIPHWISIGTSVYSKQCTLISNRVIDFDTAAQNWNWMFTNMTPPPPLTMHLLLPPLPFSLALHTTSILLQYMSLSILHYINTLLSTIHKFTPPSPLVMPIK